MRCFGGEMMSASNLPPSCLDGFREMRKLFNYTRISVQTFIIIVGFVMSYETWFLFFFCAVPSSSLSGPANKSASFSLAGWLCA